MFLKSWKFWSFAFVIGSFSALLAFGLTKDPKKVPSPLLNQPAPSFSLKSLFDDTKQKSLSSFQGKPLVINFWASWCTECRIEAGTLKDFYQKSELQEKRATLIGIAIQDTEDRAKGFAIQFQKEYFLALDNSGDIAMDYGVYGVPETFFIDAQGIVRYKHIGVVTPELMEDTLNLLESF